ncbi:hypothetical protein ASG73_00435 [Janibacter sp. Soil728]|nr:hypothetical protein ASG73_00435 [Janibacter sp. Soil728]
MSTMSESLRSRATTPSVRAAQVSAKVLSKLTRSGIWAATSFTLLIMVRHASEEEGSSVNSWFRVG